MNGFISRQATVEVRFSELEAKSGENLELKQEEKNKVKQNSEITELSDRAMQDR